MNKRMVAFVMMLVLCFVSVSAFAASSKTTNDVVDVVVKPAAKPAAKPVAVPTETVVEEVEDVVSVTVATNEETKATVEEIAAFVEGGASVVEFFGEETVLAVEAEVGTKATELKLDEYVAVKVEGTAKAGAQLTIEPAADYSEKDTVVVVASATVNGQKVNKVVTYSIVNGKLVINITEELAALLAAGQVDFAILSDLAA